MILGSDQRGARASFRAGNAGLIASFVIAVAGAILGAGAAYLGEFGAGAAASTPGTRSEPVRVVIEQVVRREEIVRRVIERFPLERFAAPEIVVPSGVVSTPAPRPRIAIIVDDIGLDPDGASAALSLPGPVSYSILPYAKDIEWLALRAARGGGDVMLHLPMEPEGDEDPGPNALRSDMSRREFLRTLAWNLSRFDGYVGVNNHMGSKLTANWTAMNTVLAHIAHRDVYFIDSKTTNASVAFEAGAHLGAVVLARDVFLDPTPGDKEEVRRQLKLVEQIAVETGYAVAIAHPRPETLSVLGPWLASAQARGFMLTTPSEILRPKQPTLLVAAPDLRG